MEEKISLRYPGRAHRVEQRQRADGVVVPVPFRVGHGLAGGDEPGEVQHRVEAGLPGQHLRRVVHPALDELGLGGHLRGVVAGQVVEHDHPVAGVEQQPA